MIDLIRARMFIHEMTAQLTEARALVRALEALKTVSGALAPMEALENRLLDMLGEFPSAPACLLPPVPSVNVRDDYGALELVETAKNADWHLSAPVTAREVFGDD